MGMDMLNRLKARFPKLYPAMTAVVLLGSAGGFAVHERIASQSCCHPGAACCHPGAACCNGAHLAQK